jgi:hypothetical protein
MDNRNNFLGQTRWDLSWGGRGALTSGDLGRSAQRFAAAACGCSQYSSAAFVYAPPLPSPPSLPPSLHAVAVGVSAWISDRFVLSLTSPSDRIGSDRTSSKKLGFQRSGCFLSPGATLSTIRTSPKRAGSQRPLRSTGKVNRWQRCHFDMER